MGLDLGSVGAAIFPEDGVEMTALVDRADQVMYPVKRGLQQSGVAAVR